MSRVVADAAVYLEEDPVVSDMMDIQKACPNSSRNAMDKALELAGVPRKLRSLLAGIDSSTAYRC
eukprot:2398974-Alexandrium_andersonii.AAC.1